MSQRVKRPNRSDDGSVPVKRRKRPTAAQAEEEETTALASWRPSNDLKIYNRTTTEAPAELFRKDLISAMKLPDSEPLASDEYWVIVDQWKQEWERGVQVPVNPDSLPEPSVTVTHCNVSVRLPTTEFKPPKTKYIRITKDDNFKPEEHALSSAPAQSEAACSYDLDECDVAWLKLVNSERSTAGLSPIAEDQLERVVERLEIRCWDKIQSILRNEEGLGIEYDENVICDVCRSPDSEEGNEMVFCDSCNICVHQACYGITRIPEGQWLCCTCTISQRPECVLCPNKGGAMKCTRSGQKWAHVSCALWIPEVSIGCVEKMEPITKISSIPQSRWALICVLCRERVGACIQCSVKTCKTAYHVTCAFKHGLEMRAIIEDENADDGVKLRSYCEKHSKSSKKEKSICSGSEDDDCKRKKRKDMTSEEKNQARAARSAEIEAEFYKHVSAKDIAVHIDVDSEALQCIYNYWKLKRKAGNNRPLLPPKSEDVDVLSQKQEQADLEKMKMFVQLRQDLERVRNLCYMVSRREKLSRSFFRMREQTFHKQAAVLEEGSSLGPTIVQAVIEANHGPSIYDRLYSHNEAEDHSKNFEVVLARIAGIKSPNESGDDRRPEVNGLFKDLKNNTYKKIFNGSKRRSGSLYDSSISSTSSSDERPKDDKENRLHSSSEDVKPPKKAPSKNNSLKTADRRRKRHSITRTKVDSSSEDDVKPPKKEWLPTSRLKQMEHELGVSGSDSDELMPMSKPAANRKAISSIYSDSDSSDISMKNDASDTQSQSRLRTKAAVKEFSNKPSTSKSPNKSSPENKKKTKEKEVKKKDYVPSDLIVPQRQAAKKATENIKSNTGGRTNKEQPAVAAPPPAADADIKSPTIKEEKEKVAKPKGKIGRPPKEVREEVKCKEEKPVKKESKKEDVFDIDKEMEKSEQDILAYVPQRQAAKKAAEHIKSGLGSKAGPVDAANSEDKNKKEPVEVKKKEVDVKPKDVKETSEAKKESVTENKRKSTSSSSTSSSSSSSSDTSSSSSSDSEDDRPKQPQSESAFSEQAKRTGAKDWPFLDKGAKCAASSSSSDSSDSSRPSSPKTAPASAVVEQKELPKPPARQAARAAPNKPGRKGVDKKPAPPEREERPPRAPRGKGRGRPRNAGDRLGNADGRPRDLPERGSPERDRTKARKGKPDGDVASEPKADDRLLPPVEADEKVKPDKEPVIDLEKEIMERKVASNKTTNCKPEKTKATTEKVEPKEVKKSPVKTKSIEDIFANKISNATEHKKNHVAESQPDLEVKAEVVETPEVICVEPVVVKSPEPEPEPELEPESEPVQNRSIFSPNPHKDADILADINNMLDDGFGISSKDEEVVKGGPLRFSIGNSILFKEDSKEDSARETMNLIEKLRGGLSKKGYEIDDPVKNDNEQIVPNAVLDSSSNSEMKEQPPVVETVAQVNLEMRVEVTEICDEPKEFRQVDQPTIQPEANKNVPEIEQQHLDVAPPTDERWVPPSDAYPPVDVKAFNEHEILPPYIQQYEHLQPQPQDDTHKIDSPNVRDRRVTQTPFLDPTSMDCMTSPSPYNDIHPQAKWADSQVMPTRRSSSSSAVSTASNGSRRNDVDDELLKRPDMLIMNHPTIDGIPFGVLPFPQNSLETFPQYSEASQFVSTPVSLFPSGNINTQIPFPSPGAAMFPPPYGTSFSASHSVIPPIPKPTIEDHFPQAACTAAFTSSQHNMALTAAMVNIPPVPPSPKNDPIVEKPAVVEEVPPSPALSNSTPNHVEPSPNPSLKSNSSAGKKSPSKPTRMSARFINKSPSKSPGKSPRQEPGKAAGTGRGRDGKKGAGKAGRGAQTHSRGRGGRGRGGRGRSVQHDYDFPTTNTIHNKLVGTVYDLDFDDDINEMGDLRTMRERRKSVDVHDRKLDARDSSESPKFTSPNNKGRYNTDLSELRPPTPIEVNSKPPTPDPPVEEPKTFPSIVQPVLPGPVDMRTYNNSFEYNDNLLGAFSQGTADQPANEELDEYFEKELHSALTASLKKPAEPQVPEVSTLKVSLSDSRNQLKVKIKGPFSNNTSTVAPLPPASDTTVSNIPTNAVSNNSTTNLSASVNSGTSTSLRRMRKKELLRQYWTQDMNMDDPTVVPGFSTTPVAPSINRTIITIPKAVASMTSIPTKDDYRDYRTGSDEIFETTKARKEKPARPGLSRELRQLDIPVDDDNSMERRRSIGSNNSNSGFDTKRRGRPPRPSQTAPKLKIKIGGNSIVGSGKIDDKRDRIRPPKKRLSAAAVKPSVEDLKRESMKFRKQVMANFDTNKVKKKKDKSNKKSKKKKKQEVQIISSNEGGGAPKLIIRFGKKAAAEPERTGSPPSEPKKDADDVSNKDSDRTECASEVRTNKVTPIKLKLSRCQEGSGYVMKAPQSAEEKSKAPTPPPTPLPTPPPALVKSPASTVPTTLNLPEPTPPVHTATPLPLNKDCEVR